MRRALCALAFLVWFSPIAVCGAVNCGDSVTTPNTTITLSSPLDCSLTNTDGLDVKASGVTIQCASNVTITGGFKKATYGIRVNQDGATVPLTNVSVIGCTIQNFEKGIRYDKVNGGTIQANTIRNSTCISS